MAYSSETNREIPSISLKKMCYVVKKIKEIAIKVIMDFQNKARIFFFSLLIIVVHLKSRYIVIYLSVTIHEENFSSFLLLSCYLHDLEYL